MAISVAVPVGEDTADRLMQKLVPRVPPRILAPLIRLLGDKVEAVVTRLLGVLLAALAAQYVIDGLKGSFGI